jgi:hypothetical protein
VNKIYVYVIIIIIIIIIIISSSSSGSGSNIFFNIYVLGPLTGRAHEHNNNNNNNRSRNLRNGSTRCMRTNRKPVSLNNKILK